MASEDCVFLIALLLGGMIVLHETIRVGKRSQIDFLLGASFLYLICYCVVPIFIQTLKDTDLRLWNWIFRLPFDGKEFVQASVLSIAGYALMVVGYYVTAYSPVGVSLRNKLSNRAWGLPETMQVLIGSAFGLIGVISYIIYAQEVGGFMIVIQAVGFFRSQTEPYSDFGFLIKVAPFTTVSSYMFWDLFVSSSHLLRKTAYCVVFALMFLWSLVILYSLGVRMQFIFYLLSFVLYVCFRRGGVSVKGMFIAGVLFTAVSLFGKDITSLYFMEEGSLEKTWEEVTTDPFAGMKKILLEFSFPFVNLANIVELVPGEVNYRWFLDLPLAAAYMLPKPLLGLSLPPTVTMIYDEYIDHPIPIDLLSFGYASVGMIGMVLVYFTYGSILYLADWYFPPSGNRLSVLLRAAWLLYLSSQVMYGNPHHALVTGFPLLVATVIIVLCGRCDKVLDPGEIRAIGARGRAKARHA